MNNLNYFYLWPLAEVPTYRDVRRLSVARLFVARRRGQRFRFRANFFVGNLLFRSTKRLTHHFSLFHTTSARLWTLKPNVLMTILCYLDICRGCRIYRSCYLNTRLQLLKSDRKNIIITRDGVNGRSQRRTWIDVVRGVLYVICYMIDNRKWCVIGGARSKNFN